MRGLVPKFIMLICLLHINFRPFDPCERVLTGVDSGVSFELHRIVLLLFFLLDAAKTSPQTQNICPLFVCRMKRNMK